MKTAPKKQKKEYIDLQEVVEQNYDKIKAGEYEWYFDEQKIVERLIHKFVIINKLKFKNADEKEQFVIDVENLFFRKVLKNYDITQNTKVTTYLYKSTIHHYYTYLEKSAPRRRREEMTDSLDVEKLPPCTEQSQVNDNLKLKMTKDLLVSHAPNPAEELIKSEERKNKEIFDKFIGEKIKENEILYKYYVEGKTVEEIAGEIGKKHPTVVYHIQQSFKKIKQEIKEKGYVVPSQYMPVTSNKGSVRTNKSFNINSARKKSSDEKVIGEK